MARSLLIMGWNHCERPPVYSVTSEAATNAPFQSAPPRAARSDSNPGSGTFGSLVDSNTSSDTSNSAATAPPQPAWQSRSDNAPPAANSGGSPNTAPAGPSANTDSSNQGAPAAPPTSANTGTGANAAPPSQAKSGSSKSDTAKSTAKSSSGGTSVTGSSTDAAASAQQAATAAINAIATAIPVTVAVTAAPPASSTSGDATAPLAIAAAAIAASMSATAAAPAASSAQAKIDSGATTAVIADPTATAADAAAIAADTTATTKTGIQASTGQPTPTPVKPQIAAPVTAVATAVAATAPVAPKTTTSSKAAAATPTGTATSGSSKTTPGATDPAATTAQPAATTGTQDASGSTVDAAKSDASANPALTPVVSGTVHERSAGAETGHTPTDTSGAGAQALGSVGPQLLSATTGAAPTPSLSVTAATNAPVPLSGLALEIAASVKNGKSSFEIRLDPADLGRIDVRIDVDRSGQVTSHLTVEKPETLSMLQQDAPQLQRALDDAGLKTGSGGLQFSLRDQSSSSQNSGNQTGSNAQRLVVSEEDTIPAAVAGRTYGRMLGSSSGVDIRV